MHNGTKSTEYPKNDRNQIYQNFQNLFISPSVSRWYKVDIFFPQACCFYHYLFLSFSFTRLTASSLFLTSSTCHFFAIAVFNFLASFRRLKSPVLCLICPSLQLPVRLYTHAHILTPKRALCVCHELATCSLRALGLQIYSPTHAYEKTS